jgi:hypothetical protein
LETTTRLIAEAKAYKGSSQFGGAGSSTVQQEQAAALNIFNKKQALRDITDIDIINVTTLDELKALWNEELLGPSPYTK